MVATAGTTPPTPPTPPAAPPAPAVLGLDPNTVVNGLFGLLGHQISRPQPAPVAVCGCGGRGCTHCYVHSPPPAPVRERSFAPLWIAMAALLAIILLGWIVGALLSSKDKEITGLETETKIADVRTDLGKEVARLDHAVKSAAAKADAVLATARHELADEAHLVRDELKDGLAKKLDKSDFEAYRRKAAAMSKKQREETTAALKAIGDQVFASMIPSERDPSKTVYHITGSVRK